MTDPKKHIVDADSSIEDIDLDETEVYVGGERLTDERAEHLAEQTLAEIRKRNLVPGGKSLSGEGEASPSVQFRVPEQLRDELARQAEAEGVSPSRLARVALAEYLNAHKAS